MSNQPKTPSLFNDILDSEFSWRIKELSLFRNNIPNDSKDKAQTTMIRAGIALLYAHWEGFIKKAANTYYAFLQYQTHKICDYQSNLIALLLKQELGDYSQTKRNSKEQGFFNQMLGKMDEIAFFPSYTPIKTSNLNYDIFEDICVLTNVNVYLFDLQKEFINEKLLEKRNKIAHGNYLDVDYEEFIEVYRKIIEILRTFKTEITNSVALKRYLRNP